MQNAVLMISQFTWLDVFRGGSLWAPGEFRLEGESYGCQECAKKFFVQMLCASPLEKVLPHGVKEEKMFILKKIFCICLPAKKYKFGEMRNLMCPSHRIYSQNPP
jgi:hypothetical protein